MEPKHSSATVAACAEAVSISAVYFMLSLLKIRKETRRNGRHASVSADSSGDVMNIRTRPKMATTVDRNAIDMEIVPALFMSLVSWYSTANVKELDLQYQSAWAS